MRFLIVMHMARLVISTEPVKLAVMTYTQLEPQRYKIPRDPSKTKTMIIALRDAVYSTGSTLQP